MGPRHDCGLGARLRLGRMARHGARHGGSRGKGTTTALTTMERATMGPRHDSRSNDDGAGDVARETLAMMALELGCDGT